MRLLLDTHLVLWWEGKHPRLTQAVEELVRGHAEAVFVSRASVWEVAIKISMGRLKMDIAEFIGNIERHGFEWLEIKNHHLIAVAALPTYEDHRDPFDRLLVAQSQVEPLTLVTADSRLARYGSTVHVI